MVAQHQHPAVEGTRDDGGEHSVAGNERQALGLVALEPRIARVDEELALRQNSAGEVVAANRPRDGLRGTEP